MSYRKPSSPWLPPSTDAPERAAPDSFLFDTKPVFLRVAPPEKEIAKAPLVIDLRKKGSVPTTADAFTVTLRKPSGINKKKLVAAITEFMVAKYAVDKTRVTLR